MWTQATAGEHLRANWTNVKSVIAFLGIGKLWTFYEGALSRAQIENILSSFESYSVMREESHPKNRKYQGFSMPTHLWNVCESDSFSVEELSGSNQGVKHILCVLNTFSKMAFVYPMMDRSGQSGLDAVKDIFTFANVYPDALVSDAGGETSCKLIVDFLHKKGTKTIIAQGSNKVSLQSIAIRPMLVMGSFFTLPSQASSVERFQRTLQKRIYTYMQENQTNTFLNVLPDIVYNYNNTIHSTTKRYTSFLCLFLTLGILVVNMV